MSSSINNDDEDKSVDSFDSDDSASEVEPLDDTDRKTLASKKTCQFRVLRGLVFLVLAVTAAFVSTVGSIYIKKGETAEFHDEFQANAKTVVESFHRSAVRTMEAVDALSVAITSYAKQSNRTFPYVTVPDFELRGANTRILSGTFLLSYSPIVQDKDRSSWEEYVGEVGDRQHEEALATFLFQSSEQDARLTSNRTLQEDTISSNITFFDPEVGFVPKPLGSGPFLPAWQVSPPQRFKYGMNVDLFSHPFIRPGGLRLLETGKAVLNAAFINDVSENYFREAFADSQYRNGFEQFLGDPTSTFIFPVFDSFDPHNRTVAGIVNTNINWRQFFVALLPKSSVGIYCVLKNSFDQTLSFRIDGPKASFVGEGDFHDPAYNNLEAFADVNEFVASKASAQTRSYTSVELDDEFGRYTLFVYPSKETEAVFHNNDTTIFCVILTCVFLFSSLVFIGYDYTVGRRLDIVLERAMASSAIVSSLFPSQVRGQLYNGAKEPQSNREQTAEEGDGSSPNAKTYDATTVLFADLSGFTRWSSSRTPEQVFAFLERIFGEFDTLAARRNVFKVETIGDCYMAVTGVPKPSNRHAVTMARFASDCVVALRRIVHESAYDLGEDTRDIDCRIGLHSGPVTAGVLKGQKARFQLFGDTVNSASRMESTGEAGRIQVSESTKEALALRGKAHWAQPREGLVQAKGKGLLQTYWLVIDHGAQSVHSSLDSSARGNSHPDNVV